MVLNCCDDWIWLSPDNAPIKECVDKLKGLGHDLILADDGDIFGFSGINFQRTRSTVELTQTGLINKTIKCTNTSHATPRSTLVT